MKKINHVSRKSIAFDSELVLGLILVTSALFASNQFKWWKVERLERSKVFWKPG